MVFDLEAVLLDGPDFDVALAVLHRCFSRYRIAAVSARGDGNVAVKAELDATTWGAQIEIVVTPKEADGPRAYRAVCSALGVQPPSAAVVTTRPEVAADANQAGLAVVFVGPAAPSVSRADRAVVTVESVSWVPQALQDLIRMGDRPSFD